MKSLWNHHSLPLNPFKWSLYPSFSCAAYFRFPGSGQCNVQYMGWPAPNSPDDADPSKVKEFGLHGRRENSQKCSETLGKIGVWVIYQVWSIPSVYLSQSVIVAFIWENCDFSELNDLWRLASESAGKHVRLVTTNIFPDHCNSPFHFWLLDIPDHVSVEMSFFLPISMSTFNPSPVPATGLLLMPLQLQKTCQSSLRNLTKMAMAIWKWKSSVQLGKLVKICPRWG